MSVLWLKGLPNDRMVKASVDRNGEILFSTGGSINMFAAAGPHPDWRQIVLPGPPRRLARPSLIVNEISNPESHADALEAAHNLCRLVGCPVVNAPARVLHTTRERVSATLQGSPGLIVPRTLLVTPRSPDDVLRLAADNDIAFPFIIRETATHGGETMLRIDAAADAHQMHALRFDGRGMHLIEYVDYRDADGLYRKYRLVMVDGEPFLRHLLLSEQWMVHASAARQMEQQPAWLDEEMRTLHEFDTALKPRVIETLKSIDALLGLDYWGMDCSLRDDGRLLLFEANCNMNVTLNTRADKTSTQPFVDRITRRFRQMVERKSKETA